MALVTSVKNIFVRIWAWLETLVREEAAYQRKLSAEKLQKVAMDKMKAEASSKIDDIKADVKETAVAAGSKIKAKAKKRFT